MCLTPHRIKNPLRGRLMVGKSALKPVKDIFLGCTKDTTAQFIEVPCGHCPQCVALKQSYTIQRTQLMSMAYDLWMCTLTYKNDVLPRTEINGYNIAHVAVSDWQDMIKRLRRRDSLGTPFKAFAVTEYGGKRHRPHIHAIFATPKIPGESRAALLAREKFYHDTILGEWRRNVATCYNRHGELVPNTRNPRYVPLCKYVKIWKNGKWRTTYDFHWIDPTVVDKQGKIHDASDVGFYVTKYLMKADKYVQRLQRALRLNLSPEEYKKAWALLRPKALVSKGWGIPRDYNGNVLPRVRDHVRKGIEMAQNDKDALYSYFINPETGQTFPLSPYLRKYFEAPTDVLTYYYRQPDQGNTEDGFRFDNNPNVKYSQDEIKRKYEKHEHIKRAINCYGETDHFNFNHDNEIFNDEVDWIIEDTLCFDSLIDYMALHLGTVPDYGDVPPDYECGIYSPDSNSGDIYEFLTDEF